MSSMLKASTEVMKMSHSDMVMNRISGMTEKLMDQAGRLESILSSVSMSSPLRPDVDSKTGGSPCRPELFDQLHNHLNVLDEQIGRISHIADSIEL